MIGWHRGTYHTLNTVHVEHAALHHNLEQFRARLPGMAIAPVLKANAYGHGLIEAATLFAEKKPEFLIVDSLYEAYKIREALRSVPILILGFTFPENLEGRRLPFHFAVSDLETARVLARTKAPLHLKIETGMSRMGFSVEELPQILPKLKALKVDVQGLLTHLADADNPQDNTHTRDQLARFHEAIKLVRREGFTPQWIHAGGGGGEMVRADLKGLTMARLGISLYGVSNALPGLHPAMKVTSTIVGVRELKAGDKVSYNGTFVAPGPMRLGVVPFGYYEGFPRSLSNKGCMQVKGKTCPIVGRVCMNYTMIDLSAVEGAINVGDEVVVYSNDPTAPNSFAVLAKQADTIPYELMVGLAESIRRVVV